MNLIHFSMRRRTVHPEIRSFVLLLRTNVTPFDSENFMKMRTVPKGGVFLATERVNSAPNKRGETKVRIFGKEKCRTLRQYYGCKFLARKSAKLIANFSATMVTSLPSFSISLYLSLPLSL